LTRTRLLSSILAATLVAAAVVVSGTAPTRAASSEGSDDSDRVPNHYLVDLKKGVDPVKYSKKIAAEYDGKATFAYDKVLGGFAFEGSSDAARRLARDERVEGVEQDGVVKTSDDPPNDVNHLTRDRVPEAYAAGYRGAGITIAILDTGVDANHEVFQEHSNILPGYGQCGGTASFNDLNGHGTRTASNAVGRIGVAHEAKVIPVKVFPRGSLATTWSRVVCGLNYVQQHSSEIDVVNMSIAGPGSAALRKATRQIISSGITVVAAAGNNGGATQAPARYKGVIAASALASGDRIASFSSTGEIAAPGVGIHSADKNGGYSDGSGTSRSSPQVAGGAAIILALDPAADVLSVLQHSGTCPGGGVNTSAGPCPGQWKGDDATAEPALNAYCAGILADQAATDPLTCGF
jgi:subtilisin family serine protease